MTDREKLHSGKVYYPSGEEIMTEQLGYLDKLYDFNMTRPSQLDLREKMLKEIDRVEKKLSNESFVAKAPQKVVDEEKAKGEKYKAMLNQIEERIAQMMK